MSNRTCSVEECDQKHRSRGWCRVHYERWRRTGDPLNVLLVTEGCSVEGCERKHYGRGFCMAHLLRWRAHGDPGSAEIEPRRPGAICSIEGCEDPHLARGWCNAHYIRWRQTGDPVTPFASRQAYQVGDDATYNTVHQRLQRLYGSASAHVCASCGASAEQWAYDHTATDEKRDKWTGCLFSTDPLKYQPMCRPCHRRFDSE